jgi:hypothetical protein
MSLVTHFAHLFFAVRTLAAGDELLAEAADETSADPCHERAKLATIH